MSERGAPLSANGFFKTLSRAAESIGMADVHPHLLRHACGYDLANRGVDTRGIQGYHGHQNIQHTVKYTATNPARQIANRIARYSGLLVMASATRSPG